MKKSRKDKYPNPQASVATTGATVESNKVTLKYILSKTKKYGYPEVSIITSSSTPFEGIRETVQWYSNQIWYPGESNGHPNEYLSRLISI